MPSSKICTSSIPRLPADAHCQQHRQAASTPETVLNVSVKTWQGRLAQPSRIHVPHSGQGLVMTIHLNDVGEHAISLGNSGAVNVER